jgi:serine/threonine-protein kinase
MGAVFEAENVALGQRVALKVLHSQLVRDADAQARFDQEAKVVSQLQTEHVVRVSDLGRTEQGEPYIVMELLAGRNLDAIIEAPELLPISYAVDLAAEAAVGLAFAHRLGLVHRDIKPGNLFETDRGDGTTIVKVLDFGLTKVTRSDMLRLTTSATVFGTPLYMSPEQIMSSKNVDARTDQHALALVLYELITKMSPFYDETPTAVTVKIATQPPAPMSSIRRDVPPGLDAIVMKALAKKPDDRFEDVAAFALAIAQFGTARADAAAKRAAAALNRPAVVPVVPAVTSFSARTPETSAPWTTRRKREAKARSRVLPAAIVGGAIVLAAGGLGYVGLRGTGGAPRATSVAARAPEPSGTAAAAVTEVVAPPPTVSPAASAPAASSAGAEPSASASSSVAPTALPAVQARPAGPRPVKSAAPVPTATSGGEYIPKYTPKK